MPNLIQLASLRENYSTNTNFKSKVRDEDIEFLFENFNRDKNYIEKAFRPQILNPDIISYFENQKEAHVVNLFIDITSFSTKASIMSNSQLSSYLDYYYDKTIPIIYKHGGEIEKIIGDGIICVFGKPFLDDDLNGLLDKADKCSKEIIVEHSDSQWEVKVALHDGIIQYYKNKSVFMEYTMVGQPLTDLFRLESISLTKAINYFCETGYDEKFNSNKEFLVVKSEVTYWERSEKTRVDLKGSAFNYIRNFEKVEDWLEYSGNYDFERGVQRIKENLTKPITTDTPLKEIPINELSSEALSIFCDSTVLVVNLRIDEKSQAIKQKCIQTIIPEILKIIKSTDCYYSIKISGNFIIGIFNTPFKNNIQNVFNCAATISSMFKFLNHKSFLKQDSINFGISISYGELLISSIEGRNGNSNYILFQGENYDRAVELSKMKIDRVIVSNSIYANLTKHQQSILGKYGHENFYYGTIIITKIDKWYEEHIK